MLHSREYWADARFVKQCTLSLLQMWKFSSPNWAARNLLGKIPTRPQAPQLHLFQDTNTFHFHPRLPKPVCSVGKEQDEGTALVWDHMGSQPCRRVWLRPQAQKWCVLHKTTFPSHLPLKQSSWHRVSFWKWEWSFPMLCLWVLLPYFLSQSSRCITNTVVLMATVF